MASRTAPEMGRDYFRDGQHTKTGIMEQEKATMIELPWEKRRLLALRPAAGGLP